jgi:hypothetical protein
MIEHSPRYAIYFAPTSDSALGAFGRGVLGRDAECDIDIDFFPQLKSNFPNWHRTVAPAAHYGFHATLKAPFALATGVTPFSVCGHASMVARTFVPVPLGRLEVSIIGSFIALLPVSAPIQLGTLAAATVRTLDPLRASLTPTERERRRPETLTRQQNEYLDTWGYPYVFDDFRFHMTLPGPLEDSERQDALHALRALYHHYDQPVEMNDVCIFYQSSRQARFNILHRIRLGD